MLDLVEVAYEGMEKSQDLAELSFHGWALSQLPNEGREWDPDVVHVSDYPVMIEGDDGSCKRNLWGRFADWDKREKSRGEQAMWDQGFALQERVSWYISLGLPKPASVAGMEIELDRWLPREDVGSADLVLTWYNESESHLRIIPVEMKTRRGGFFRFIKARGEAKPSDKLQAQGYGYAFKQWGTHEFADLLATLECTRMVDTFGVRPVVLYIDREGQNQMLQYPGKWDDEWINEQAVRQASEEANEIRDRFISKRDDPDAIPPTLDPWLSIRENKGDNSIYIESAWQCDYCDMFGKSCEGSLPKALQNNGIVAKGDHQQPDELNLKFEHDEFDVRDVIRRTARKGRVKFDK